MRQKLVDPRIILSHKRFGTIAIIRYPDSVKGAVPRVQIPKISVQTFIPDNFSTLSEPEYSVDLDIPPEPSMCDWNQGFDFTQSDPFITESLDSTNGESDFFTYH